jgi:hypothetical protein
MSGKFCPKESAAALDKRSRAPLRASQPVIDSVLNIRRHKFIWLLGSMTAAWPFVAQTQQPAMMQQTQAMTANLPQIEVVRVKRIDPAAPRFQSRLSDGMVDLMKGFSLGSGHGIGGAWKTPPPNPTFNERYGQW